MVDAAEGTSQAYSADDFEGAVERLLGKRHKVLKELEATPAQICSAFSEAFFSGELSENAENHNDISLMLTVSTEFSRVRPAAPLGFTAAEDAAT